MTCRHVFHSYKFHVLYVGQNIWYLFFCIFARPFNKTGSRETLQGALRTHAVASLQIEVNGDEKDILVIKYRTIRIFFMHIA